MIKKPKYNIGDKLVYLGKKHDTKKFYQAIFGTVCLIKIDNHKIRYDTENFHDCYEEEVGSMKDAPRLIKKLIKDLL